MSQVFISAAHKSSGKTTLSIGLCAASHRRGLKVAPFKKGPDFIDPMWLSKACDHACYNLDFYTMSAKEIIKVYHSRSRHSDIRIIEGNKGLYDGLDLDGSNSNAALANLLQTPVVLVIDAQGMTRGIAPLILGYQAFDPQLNIAGVILNKLGGSRHESKLRQVIEHYTDVPVIGAVHRNPAMQILERHLGLIPSNESDEALQQIDTIASLVEQQVDLDRFLAIAGKSTPLTPEDEADDDTVVATTSATPLRIGIARDAAFGFYYPDDLEAFQRYGAQLLPLDLLHDANLPPLDGLFIGGGFPETHLEALHENTRLRHQIRDAIESGLPVYAECGGLMYLSRRICWGEKNLEMVGAIPADTVMRDRPQGRGYVKLRPTESHPWTMERSMHSPAQADRVLSAHEFHYSCLENLDSQLQFAYTVQRGTGIDGKHDGIIIHNVLASYTHMRNVAEHQWVKHFVDFVKQCKAQRDTQQTYNH